jgi:hypothetical protein
LAVPENKEIVAKKYKIQTKDRFGEWIDFGPFYFSSYESMESYFEEYKETLGKARMIEVVESVLKYVN